MDFYHVLNRGVEKRIIALDDGDRMRFVRSLYVFNDKNSVPNGVTQKSVWENMTRKRDPLVHLHAWCLMDNHYHLLLSPINNDLLNLSLFMKKLNMGYAKFFNEKYSRSGYLWQGRYRKVNILNDAHFLHIPYYIHLNPLDFSHKEWRKGNVSNPQNALDRLKKYRWSSYLDYNEKSNFPSVITKKEISKIIGSQEIQRKTIISIITDAEIAAPSIMLET